MKYPGANYTVLVSKRTVKSAPGKIMQIVYIQHSYIIHLGLETMAN